MIYIYINDPPDRSFLGHRHGVTKFSYLVHLFFVVTYPRLKLDQVRSPAINLDPTELECLQMIICHWC